MSAVLKPQEVNPYAPQVKRMVASKPKLQVLAPPVTPAPTLPFTRKTQYKYPLWLKLLVSGQRLSLGIAAITIGGTLTVYGLTANTNRQLSKSTAILDNLQEQQQQLTTANAVFKNHLAETALSDLGRGEIDPKHVIFLEANEPQPILRTAEPQPPSNLMAKKRFYPQGY